MEVISSKSFEDDSSEVENNQNDNYNFNNENYYEKYSKNKLDYNNISEDDYNEELENNEIGINSNDIEMNGINEINELDEDEEETDRNMDNNMEGHYEENEISNSVQNIENNTINTIDEENDEYNENSNTNTNNNNLNMSENISNYNSMTFPITSISNNQNIKILIDSNINKQIPFIMLEDDKFVISKDAKNLLNLIGNNKIGIISLLGQFNSKEDKFFLINNIMPNNSKVELLDNNNEKGILIYSKPLIIKNNNCDEEFPCFIIDKISLDINVNSSVDDMGGDTQIFLIIVLISSLFIFNTIGNIDQTSLTNLEYILKCIKNIKLKSTLEEENASEIGEYFPMLLWVLQNSNLKLEDKNGNTITEKQYMENELELIDGSTESIEESNNIRTDVKNYFPERDCFFMMDTSILSLNEKNKDKDKNKNKITLQKLGEQINFLKNKIVKKIKPKMFDNHYITGNMLIDLIECILNSINSGGVPILSNIWNYIMKIECIKYANNLIYKFGNELKEYRNSNINKNTFFDNNQIEKLKIKILQKYLKEFLSNNYIDEEVKKEFSEKVRNRFMQELKKYQKENEKYFEEKFIKDLNLLSNKFMENFTSSDIYEKNSYKFFQDFENFRETAISSAPNFPKKNEILFDKVLLIIKKFINGKIMKIKVINEEKNYLENENKKQDQKINELNSQLDMIKEKNNEFVLKLNNDIQIEKKKYKRVEEKINGLINGKSKELENLKKEIEIETNNYENKIKEIIETNNNLDKEIKIKDEQLVVMKMNNEKISSLYEQKSKYLEREINSWKEKYNNIIKESMNKENELNKENLKLKKQNKILMKKEKNKRDENNRNDNNSNKNNTSDSKYINSNINENSNVNLKGVYSDSNSNNINNGKENMNNVKNNGNSKIIKTNLNGLMNYIKMNFKDKKSKMLKLDKFFLNRKKESQERLKEKSLDKEDQSKIKKEENSNDNTILERNPKENTSKNIQQKKHENKIYDTNHRKENKEKANEDKLINFNQYKDLINNNKDFQCKFCMKSFNFSDFKDHYNICQKNPINMSTMNNSNILCDNDIKERSKSKKISSNTILISEKMNNSHIEGDNDNDNFSINKSNAKKGTISNSSINTNHNSSINNIVNNYNLNNSNTNNLNNNDNNTNKGSTLCNKVLNFRNKKDNSNSYSNNNITNITNITNTNTSGTNYYSDNASIVAKNRDKKNYYRNINLYYYNNSNNIRDSNTQKKVFIPQNLKIKIIKGRIRKDKSGKPYLEYIININYENIQNWNISRRFNQFTNLYKTLRTFCKGSFELPESSNIFNNITAMFSGLSHENKILQLEKFLKDLTETEGINNSKHLYCFLELNHLVDENNNIINNNDINGNNQQRSTFDSIPSNKKNNILVNSKHNYNSASMSGNISGNSNIEINSNIPTNRFKIISEILD